MVSPDMITNSIGVFGIIYVAASFALKAVKSRIQKCLFKKISYCCRVHSTCFHK